MFGGACPSVTRASQRGCPTPKRLGSAAACAPYWLELNFNELIRNDSGSNCNSMLMSVCSRQNQKPVWPQYFFSWVLS